MSMNKEKVLKEQEPKMGMTRKDAIEILEEVKTLDDSMFTYSQIYNDALDMAIEALKEQEPAKPIRKVIGCGWRYFCGECGKSIVLQQHFCPECGKKVKWE